MSVTLLPSGVVTLLFSDIVGSTRLLEALGPSYGAALAAHQEILREAVREHHGFEVSARGDEFFAVFTGATDAIAAAADVQQRMLAYDWGERPVRVRIGLHTGEASAVGDDYVGLAVHHASRICGAANAGQIVLSEETRSAASGADVVDLGKHRLKDLSKPVRLYQLSHPELPSEFAPLRTLSDLATNLPVQLTSFVGREDELRDVTKHLEMDRLVTLTGPGGVGKTRLALQVGADVADSYADGTWLVELAAVADPNRVLPAIVEALGFTDEHPDDLDMASSLLEERDVLIVLDNCEHLLGECARIVEQLLSRCPKVRVLTTTRQPLMLRGETTIRLAPLPLPEDVHPEAVLTSPAVRLFLDRVAHVRPDFVLSGDNAPLVAEICARLDGIPLAIELAASLVRALGPAEIAERLRNRLGLLTQGSRDASPQQRTLRDAIDWSYDLLDEAGRIVFRRLAVFPGTFSLDAMQDVCGTGLESDIVGVFVGIVDRSLVTVEETDTKTRYRLLEMVREYASEQLKASNDAESVGGRLVAWCAETGRRVAKTKGDDAAVDEIEDNVDSFRFALSALSDGADPWALLHAATGFGKYCRVRGVWTEGRRWLDRALASRPDDAGKSMAYPLYLAGAMAYAQGDIATARVRYAEQRAVMLAHGLSTAEPLNNLGTCALAEGKLEEAKELFQESLDECQRLGDTNVSFALSNLGLVAESFGDLETAQRYFEESIELTRTIDSAKQLSADLTNLGNVLFRRGDIARARAHYEEALALSRRSKMPADESTLLMNLGVMDFSVGRYAEARLLLQESLGMYREMSDPSGIRRALGNLGNVELSVGAYGLARALNNEALVIARKLGDVEGVGASLIGVAQADMAQRDYVSARAAFEEARGTFDDLGSVYGVACCVSGLGTISACEEKWDEAGREFDEALQIFREMGEPEGEAEALIGLGTVERALGRYANARERLRESLQLCEDIGLERGVADILDELAMVSMGEGRAEESAVRLGAADATWERIGAARAPFSVDVLVGLRTSLSDALGDERLAQLLDEGRGATVRDLIEEPGA